jgi:hypothetical protein
VCVRAGAHAFYQENYTHKWRQEPAAVQSRLFYAAQIIGIVAVALVEVKVVS